MKNAKKRSARVASRADIVVTNGPIDMRQIRLRREMQGLAYVVSLDERRMSRAVLMAPSVKICGFWTFFTIQVGAQKVIDFRRRDKRSFAEECAGFKIHRKRRLSFGHSMLYLNRPGNTILTKIGLCVDYTALPSKPWGQYREKLCSRKAHSILSDTYPLFINFCERETLISMLL